MKFNKLIIAFSIITIGIFNLTTNVSAQEEKKAADPNIVVIMKGLGTPVSEPRQPGVSCLQGDLYNAVTDKKIGTGVDCFDNINFVSFDPLVFSMDRTTYFNFPEGELVATGVTTMQPVLAGSPSATHLSGDHSQPG